MTVQREALGALDQHWALESIGKGNVRSAHLLANRLYVRATLDDLHSSSEIGDDARELIDRVAFAYEVIAAEGIEELLKAPTNRVQPAAQHAEAAAYRSFELLRAIPLVTDGGPGPQIRQILRVAAVAYCSDRWAEFQGWLRDRELGEEPADNAGQPWDQRVLSDLGKIWIRLLRKDGWSDLEEVAQIVTQLRADQQDAEQELFDGQEHDLAVTAKGWRLVALYHWARLSELVATYLMQGEPADVHTEVDFHFDRAVAAANQAADPEFSVTLRWQRVMVHRMLAGSLWAVTRIGPEIRNVVETVSRARSMFEMLPPQRIAIQEQGLLDPASAAVVVDLPTSAGKTLLAEFKIVQALNQFQQARGWVAYVAPTRALVAQIARRLRRDLSPSGLKVEELTAAVEIDGLESALLAGDESEFDILVATPEKLNLVIRANVIERPLALVVLDEAHNIEDSDRGVRIELLLATIKRDCRDANFLLMMPFVPNGDELARWLAPQSGKSISLATVPWQPNDRLIGVLGVQGSARNWVVDFEPLITSSPSLEVEESFTLGTAAGLDKTASSVRNNLGLVAGAAALPLSQRGTAIVICSKLKSVWSVAEAIAAECEDPGPDDDIELVRRYLRTEISPDFALVDLLAKRVGVHHSGLSDETRTLMEWLAERGKLRVLVATTGLSQGLNFPVSSILLASRHLPAAGFSREMSPREFWNLAGRAGRVDQDSIGVVGIASKPEQREEIVRFVSGQAGALVSRLVTLLNELEDAGRLIDLERSIFGDQWADFRSYVAHLFAQKKNLDAVLAETELLLRGTFGYSVLAEASPADRAKSSRLLEATRAYAEELAGRVETATLADSTGFTPEGIRTAMAGLRGVDDLDMDRWRPESLFGGGEGSALPDLMRVMLTVPQIRDSISELTGAGGGLGDQAAKIAADWVAGTSLKEIAERYFASGETSATESMTAATKAIYRHLTMAGTWGLSALSRLPGSGIDYEAASAEELRRINLLGAMLYHGVDTEAGVLMRMSSVPRSVARSIGEEYASTREEAALRPSAARNYLGLLEPSDWQRHVRPGASMDGADYERVWRVLSGEMVTPREKAMADERNSRL